MKLNWNVVPSQKKSVVALGTFDGVHLGHQQLLSEAVNLGKVHNLTPTVFTFDLPPEQFFSDKRQILTDLAQKQKVILDSGIENFVWTEFNQEFAKITPEAFIEELLIDQLQAEIVVCGFDYRFGHQARGNPQLLEEIGMKHGLGVKIIPPYALNETIVSSTQIRRYLNKGDIAQAKNLLGRYPSYTGKIVSGKQLGRKLGFPTANIKLNPNLLIPNSGVYLTWCYLEDGNNYPAMTSVGSNPTVAGKEISIESYLIGYEGNLYGTTIDLEFLTKMREMIHFESLELLKDQLSADLDHALEILPHFRLQ